MGLISLFSLISLLSLSVRGHKKQEQKRWREKREISISLFLSLYLLMTYVETSFPLGVGKKWEIRSRVWATLLAPLARRRTRGRF